MKFNTYTLKIFLLSIILSCYGCEYENPVTNQKKVQGNLVGDKSFPLSDRFIALNSSPIAALNLYGEFYFENVSTPFDLNVFHILGFGEISIYKNIKNRFPVLQINGLNNYSDLLVVLRIKNTNWDKIILAQFISNSSFSGRIVSDNNSKNDRLITYNLRIPITETQIEGKFILLKCIYGSSLISIDDFAEKSYTVRTNIYDTLVFQSEDFNFNPNEANVNVNIINNPFAISSDTYIYIDFLNYKFSPLLLSKINTGFNQVYNFIVPESLPLAFKIRTENRSVLIQDSSYIFFKKWIYLNPLEYGSINYNSSFGLLDPADNQTNVDRNTKFIIHNEDLNGIYNFIIKAVNTYKDFEVFTDSKEITLPHLSELGFTLEPNTQYEWYAEKYTNFENIDDFVSSPYKERKENGSLIESKQRKFRTSTNY